MNFSVYLNIPCLGKILDSWEKKMGNFSQYLFFPKLFCDFFSIDPALFLDF